MKNLGFLEWNLIIRSTWVRVVIDHEMWILIEQEEY